jgi:hypothetical protein
MHTDTQQMAASKAPEDTVPNKYGAAVAAAAASKR